MGVHIELDGNRKMSNTFDDSGQGRTRLFVSAHEQDMYILFMNIGLVTQLNNIFHSFTVL